MVGDVSFLKLGRFRVKWAKNIAYKISGAAWIPTYSASTHMAVLKCDSVQWWKCFSLTNKVLQQVTVSLNERKLQYSDDSSEYSFLLLWSPLTLWLSCAPNFYDMKFSSCAAAWKRKVVFSLGSEQRVYTDSKCCATFSKSTSTISGEDVLLFHHLIVTVF